ncbi:hypothetical protein FRC17_003697, partial [Serendipita sp. 399]
MIPASNARPFDGLLLPVMPSLKPTAGSPTAIEDELGSGEMEPGNALDVDGLAVLDAVESPEEAEVAEDVVDPDAGGSDAEGFKLK